MQKEAVSNIVKFFRDNVTVESLGLIKDNGTPLFNFLGKAFTDPIAQYEAFKTYLRGRNLGEIIGDLKNLAVEYNTVTDILVLVVMLISFYTLFVFCFNVVFGMPRGTIFKTKVFTFIYLAFWGALGYFGYKQNPEVLKRLVDEAKLPENVWIFGIAVLTTLLVSVLLFLAFSYFAEILIAIPFIGSFILVFFMYFRGYRPERNTTLIFLGVMALLFMVGAGLHFFLGDDILDKKNLISALIKNILILAVFILVLSAINYLQIQITLTWWETSESGKMAYFFAAFMNSWSYYTTAYLVTVFTSSLMTAHLEAESRGRGKEASFSGRLLYALGNTYKSLDLACYCSAFIAIFYTAIAIINFFIGGFKSYESKWCNVVIYPLSIIHLALCGLCYYVDFNNTNELTKVGIVGFDEFLKGDEHVKKLLNEETSSMSKKLVGFKTTLYFLFCLISASTLKSYMANMPSMVFTSFIVISLLINLLNSAFITMRVNDCVRARKTNKV